MSAYRGRSDLRYDSRRVYPHGSRHWPSIDAQRQSVCYSVTICYDQGKRWTWGRRKKRAHELQTVTDFARLWVGYRETSPTGGSPRRDQGVDPREAPPEAGRPPRSGRQLYSILPGLPMTSRIGPRLSERECATALG